MTQLKELLDKEELEQMKEVKEEIKAENSGKKSSSEDASMKEKFTGNDSMEEKSGKGKGSNAWIWVAAIVAAVLILK